MSETMMGSVGDQVAPPRRTSWIFVALGVLFVVGGGGYLAFEKLHLIQKVPAGWVISSMDPSGGAAKDEAMRRYEAGVLNREQRAAFLYQMMQTPILEVRDPHPADKEVPLSVRPVFNYPDAEDWQIELKKWTLKVDGAVKSEGQGDGKVAYNVSTAPIELCTPVLSEGKHEVMVDLTYAVWEVSRIGDEPHLMTERTVSVKQAVTVEGKLDELVELRSSEALAEKVKQNIRLMAVRMEAGDQPVDFQVSTSRLPMGMAVEILARKSGEGEYVRVGTFSTSTRVRGVEVMDQTAFKGAKKIDVAFVPSRAVAFDGRMGECFGGTVEWIGLRILPEARLKRILFGGPKYDPPTRVTTTESVPADAGGGAV